MYKIARKFNIGLYLIYFIIGLATIVTHHLRDSVFPLLVLVYDFVTLFALVRGLRVTRLLVAIGMAGSICFVLANTLFAELAPLSPLLLFYLALAGLKFGERVGALLFLVLIYGSNLFWLVPNLDHRVPRTDTVTP